MRKKTSKFSHWQDKRQFLPPSAKAVDTYLHPSPLILFFFPQPLPSQLGTWPAPAPVPSYTTATERHGSQRVRRNLFMRSVSMNAASSSGDQWWLKRERDEDQFVSAKKTKGIISTSVCLSLACRGQSTCLPPLWWQMCCVFAAEFSKNVVVKQTPDKKQTGDYWQRKMMRRRYSIIVSHFTRYHMIKWNPFFTRSKSMVENSPGTQVIEESPQRLFYSSTSSHPHPVPGVSLLGSEEATCTTPPQSYPCSRLQLKDPSPAAIFSLLHGEMMSPPLLPTTNSHDNSLSSTHHQTKSPDLFATGHTPSLPSDSAPPLRTYRAARSLTYLSESPLAIHSPDNAQNMTPVKSILKSPDGTPTPKSSEKKSVTFDMGLDFQQDSASRVAFALSTPTKDDAVDFTGCLDNQDFTGCLRQSRLH